MLRVRTHCQSALNIALSPRFKTGEKTYYGVTKANEIAPQVKNSVRREQALQSKAYHR